MVGDAIVGRRLSPAAKAPLGGEALGGGIQHIFDEAAIAGGGIVDQDVGKVIIPTRFDGPSNTESVE